MRDTRFSWKHRQYVYVYGPNFIVQVTHPEMIDSPYFIWYI